MAVRTEDFSNVEQQIDGISGEKYREIGDQAVWSLSSCKPGFGVEQLRDGNLDTYWQSDGPQPHLISVQFRRKTAIQNICLYADYKLDESYTPSKISIRAGNHFHDLHQIELIELEEPNGWLTVSLSDGDKPLRTYMLQVAVLANHQNGRDTHMRQIKIHAPSTDTGTYKMPTFTSVECAMYSTIKWSCLVFLTQLIQTMTGREVSIKWGGPIKQQCTCTCILMSGEAGVGVLVGKDGKY